MLQLRARDQLYKRGVGLLFVGTLLAILFVFRVVDRHSTSMKNTFFILATAQRVDGLEIDSKVTAAGLPVGKVRSIQLAPDRRLHVRMEIDSNLQTLLREDSVAVLSKPMIGSAIVDISLGSEGRPSLKDGASIPMVSAPDINEIVSTIPARLEKVDAVMDQLMGLTKDLRQDAQQLMSATAPVQATLKNFENVSGESVKAVRQLNLALEQTGSVVSNTRTTVNEANTLLRQLQSGATRIDPVLERLDVSLKNLQTIGAELLTVTPLIGPTLQAGHGAMREADDVLNAAKRSVLLNGAGQSVGPSPILITPRAP